MKPVFRFAAFCILITALAACGRTEQAVSPIQERESPSPEALASPTVSPSSTPTPSPLPSPAVAAEAGQTYQDKNDLFQIAFPKGYLYQETGSGVAFVSPDQGFAGAVDFGSAEGSQLTPEQLETALKTEYENRLQNLTWQESKPQGDGSIRVDWVGKDQAGNRLDAVSFVEQRGDTIFILNLFGVNKPYQDYQKDAEAIVNSYQVRQ